VGGGRAICNRRNYRWTVSSTLCGELKGKRFLVSIQVQERREGKENKTDLTKGENSFTSNSKGDLAILKKLGKAPSHRGR